MSRSVPLFLCRIVCIHLIENKGFKSYETFVLNHNEIKAEKKGLILKCSFPKVRRMSRP